MKKKPKKKVLPTITIVFILIIGIIIISRMFLSPKKVEEVKVVSTIEKYNYTLDNNETDIYQKYFKELDECLKKEEIDRVEYSNLISKLFVIDFYTLNNKITNKDIGGVQFLKEDIKKNFSLKASNTMYKYIKSNIYGKRKQKLPEVEDVELIENKEIFIDDLNENGYTVELLIKYVEEMGYPKRVILTLATESDKINIIKIKEVVQKK